jgi:hypothetical protein
MQLKLKFINMKKKNAMSLIFWVPCAITHPTHVEGRHK